MSILQILWVKKCRNFSGAGGEREIFPYHCEYFSHAENLELIFCSTAFADKIIRVNIMYNSFYQLVVNMGEIFAAKGKGPRK